METVSLASEAIAGALSSRKRIVMGIVQLVRVEAASLARLPTTPSYANDAIMIDPALVKCHREAILASMLGCM
jgi:hypothetical protein